MFQERYLMAAAATLFIVCLGMPAPLQAAGKTVGGVRFPGTVQPGSETLKFVGAGLRTKWMFKVYAMAVHQRTPRRSARHLINSNEPKFIWIRMLRTISGDKMRAAIDDGLKANVPGATRARIQSEIKKLKRSFPAKLSKGVDIGFSYVPGKGTKVQFSNIDRTTLKGKAMMIALWSIWFGKEPANEDLGDSILGK